MCIKHKLVPHCALGEVRCSLVNYYVVVTRLRLLNSRESRRMIFTSLWEAEGKILKKKKQAVKCKCQGVPGAAPRA